MSAVATRPRVLRDAMDGLVGIEQQVREYHNELRLYRWQPRVPQLPSLWNWITSGTSAIQTVAHRRDVFEIAVRVGIRHTDVDDEMAKLEDYADAVITALDVAMRPGHPFGAGSRVQWSDRTGFRTIGLELGGVDILAFECPVLIRLDRVVA